MRELIRSNVGRRLFRDVPLEVSPSKMRTGSGLAGRFILWVGTVDAPVPIKIRHWVYRGVYQKLGRTLARGVSTYFKAIVKVRCR